MQNLSDEIITTTEDKIKSYFWNLSEMGRLNTRLSLLQKHKLAVEADIQNSNIHLNTDLGGMSFGQERVQSGGPKSSPQEREIERAFANLERQKEEIECSIIETGILIRDYERKNNDMQYIIKQLSEEAQKFVDLMYRMRKSYTRISIEMNMSKSSVDRYRRQVVYDVSKWICTMF